MLDHDKFYIKSSLHETLLLKIRQEIKQETIANRAGDPVKAVKHGQKVWEGLKAPNVDNRNDIKKRLKDLKTEMQKNVSSKK